MNEKSCATCKILKPRDAFNKKAANHDGLRLDCRDCQKAAFKKWSDSNPEKRKAYHAATRDVRRKRDRERQREYRKTKPIDLAAKNRERRLRDPLFKLRQDCASAIRDALKNVRNRKHSGVVRMLGAEIDTVRSHLIKSAIDRYGFHDPSFKYHIDHIVPCSKAKTEVEIMELQHYTNLQLLTPEDNWDKHCREDFK